MIFSIYIVLYKGAFNTLQRLFHLFSYQSAIRTYFEIRNKTKIPNINSPSVIFHCASIGEYEAMKPILRRIKINSPEIIIVISFFSQSGYNLVNNDHLFDYKVYSPIESKNEITLWINQLKPTVIIIAHNEIWPIFLKVTLGSSIPIVYAGVYISNTPIKRAFLKINKTILLQVNKFFIQRKESHKMFLDMGISNPIMIGRLRDEEIRNNQKSSGKMDGHYNKSNKKPLMILGSIHESDFKIFRNTIRKLADKYDLLIAPHDVNNKNINLIVDMLGDLNYSLYSNSNSLLNSIIILDEFGILKSVYKYAAVIYIGGGFGKGIHNVVEAAHHKKPIIIGKNYKNFDEAIELKNMGVLFACQDSDTFLNALGFIENKERSFFENKYLQFQHDQIQPSKVITNYLIEQNII